MLKRPSSRRKSEKKEVTLNLVPMIDALVTLITFLLFTMSFFAFVSIESPLPMTSKADVQQKLKEKPLQLTVSITEKDMEVWSPFKLIPSKKIPNLEEKKPDTKTLHELILGIKEKFPKENKIVLSPYKEASYDILVSIMDAVQTIEPTDPPLFIENPETKINEQAKFLFNQIIFGNLLGD